MAGKKFSFAVGDTVKLFSKTLATVTSVHKGGKRLGVTTEHGKTTFVNASNAAFA